MQTWNGEPLHGARRCCMQARHRVCAVLCGLRSRCVFTLSLPVVTAYNLVADHTNIAGALRTSGVVVEVTACCLAACGSSSTSHTQTLVSALGVCLILNQIAALLGA